MKQARVLNRADLKRVLTVAAANRHGQRNTMAIMLSHYAGLRVGEIASLCWEQLLDQQGQVRPSFYLIAAETKSGEARAVHLNPLLVKQLQLFRSSSMNGPVIRSQKGAAFSANSLCQLFSRIYAAAGIDGASSHSGRRWFITKLAHSGVSPKVIMELAGHKNLGTTQRYIEVNEEMKAKAVQALRL